MQPAASFHANVSEPCSATPARPAEASPGRLVGRLAAILVVAGAFALVGCHHNAPRTYEPWLRMDALAANLETPNNTYKLLAQPESRGRFPCSLAVARMSWPTASASDRLELSEMTHAEQGLWVDAFRGFAAVRDVRFVLPRSLRQFGNGIDGLLHAAHVADAELLLVHVNNRFGPNRAQVLGVIYDVAARAPLATLHASAKFLDDDGLEEAQEGRYGDRRTTDAAYQAASAFREQAADCLRQQIKGDMTPSLKEPHRWIPLYPYYWQPVPRPDVSAPPPEQEPELEAESAAPPPPPPDRRAPAPRVRLST
jgi:hypothetical protein